jgi:hypothetical protein
MDFTPPSPFSGPLAFSGCGGLLASASGRRVVVRGYGVAVG